ncbi:hypothetical protein, partial [Escherichia coli]|uniref:hypothetical protein n=1 Tax=Escherichia coli TaxID=562 RepID=UPI00197F877B
MMWNIVVLMNIYIPDWWRKSFFHALFLQKFLYGRRVCCGLMNRPGFPGECFICELRLPDHRFRWKHNKLFLLL